MINNKIASLYYRRSIPKAAIYCYVIVLSLLYIIVVAHTPLTIYPTAAFDDALFMSLGRSLAEGRWLGPFNEFILVKGPGYPAFLALGHWLGISASMAHALLHCGAIIFFVWVVHRVHGSLLLSGLLFALLLWHPVSMTVYLLRAFRDEIYYSQVLFVLALVVWTLFCARAAGQRVFFAALSGVFLGWFWLTREEGSFIVPALVLLVVTATLPAFRRQRIRELLLVALVMFGVFAGSQIAFRAVNWLAYGAFVGVDSKEANYLRALGALHSVRSGGVRPFVSITRAARQRVYGVSPTFASLASYFEGAPGSDWVRITCDASPTACGEIGAGWFMFALRRAAAASGHYATPTKASAFFGQMADEISAACVRGGLECSPQLIAEMPPVSWKQIAEGFRQDAAKIFELLILANPALQFNPSGGPEDLLNAYLRFLNYPPHTSPEHSQPASAIFSLAGWYYKASDVWLEVRVKDLNAGEQWASVRVERRPSPDIERAFNDPGATNQRFIITTRCSDECVMHFRAVDGAAADKTLAELRRAPLGFALGLGRVYVDIAEVRQGPAATPRSEEIANVVRRTLVTRYKFISLPVLFVGGCAFLFLTLFRTRQALSNLCYVVALTCWMLAVLRVGLVVLIDVTSFPALRPAYLAPAYFLLLPGAVLFCAAWLQVSYGPHFAPSRPAESEIT